jgi:hypothetical protein
LNWVDRFPERFAYELADFERRGLTFRLDEAALGDEGRVVLSGTLNVEGEPEPVELIVRYPDSFPYFRPEIYAPALQLLRHQNPIDHNLCLLDRSTRAWSPSETAAHLIDTQVPQLLRLVRSGGDALRAGEVAQGEPASYYFPPLAGTYVLISQELLEVPPEASGGIAQIAFAEAEPPTLRLRGLLMAASVREQGGRSSRIAQAGGPLADRYRAGRTIEAAWVRINDLPRSREPQALLEAAELQQPGISRPRWQNVAGGEVAVTAFVFSEEVEQGVLGDQWLFVVRTRQGSGRHAQEGIYTTRGERLSRADIQARVPQLAPLADRKVALIGLGALGAPLALDLTRPGLGELRILDFDIVEAGTTVRWPYGLSAVNAPKPEFLAQVVGRDYPLTTIVPFNRALGEVTLGARETDFDLLRRMFDGVDLVIDASAELGVQQLVSTIADDLGIPQLYVWATEGARGGVVARVLPGASGCWFCLQLAIAREAVPLPARDDAATVQPRGCGSRTFTGAGYDLAPVSTQAARVASSFLAAGRALGADDVFVCSLDGSLSPAPPQWDVAPLSREEGCRCCGRERAAA